MPIKEILLVALVVAAGHGFAWAFHSVGLSFADRQAIFLERELKEKVAVMLDREDKELNAHN